MDNFFSHMAGGGYWKYHTFLLLKQSASSSERCTHICTVLYCVPESHHFMDSVSV